MADGPVLSLMMLEDLAADADADAALVAEKTGALDFNAGAVVCEKLLTEQERPRAINRAREYFIKSFNEWKKQYQYQYLLFPPLTI